MMTQVHYAPIDLPRQDWIDRCRWEADAIEAHLAAGQNRPSVGQRKTVRLLRRLADMLSKPPTPIAGETSVAIKRSTYVHKKEGGWEYGFICDRWRFAGYLPYSGSREYECTGTDYEAKGLAPTYAAAQAAVAAI